MYTHRTEAEASAQALAAAKLAQEDAAAARQAGEATLRMLAAQGEQVRELAEALATARAEAKAQVSKYAHRKM